MKRWSWQDGEYHTEPMVEDAEGLYVLYADAQAALEAKDRRIQQLEEALRA